MTARSLALFLGMLILGCGSAEPEPATPPPPPVDVPPSAAAAPAQPTVGSAAPSGGCAGVVPIRITSDSIGPFLVDLPLAELRRLCPAALDTFVRGYEVSPPALLLRYDGVQIWALQENVVTDPETGFDGPGALVLTEPASEWVVTGRAAVLPGGVPMDAPFSRVREVYGRGVGFNEIRAVVLFCSLPGVRFFLDVDASQMPREEAALSAVPADARVEKLVLTRDPWRVYHDRRRCGEQVTPPEPDPAPRVAISADSIGGLPGSPGPPSIRLDPGTGNYLLTYTDLDGETHTVVVEPRNKVDPTFAVEVSARDSALVYRYALANRSTPQAERPISWIRVPCPPDGTPRSPASWNSERTPLHGALFCTFSPRAAGLQPGEQILLEITSRLLPAIIDVRVYGSAEPVLWPSMEGSVPEEVYELADRVRGRSGGWFSLPSVVPARAPAAFADPVQGLALVRSDLDRACELGWISDAGTCQRLGARLEEAGRSVRQGPGEAARGALRSFLRELQAQHDGTTGGHMGNNAYWLLRPTVEHLVGRL